MKVGEPRAWRLVGVAAGIATMVEGIVLASLDRGMDSAMAVALIVLGLFAAALLIVSVLMPHKFGRFNRVPLLVSGAIGLAVAIISVSLAYSSDRATILRMQSQPVYIVAVFCAQLFIVGMALFLAALNSERKLKLTSLLAYGGGTAAAAEGLVVVGIAAPTFIQGIGGVLGSTIQLLGTQLFLVAFAFILLSIAAMWIKKAATVLSLARSTFAVLIVLEGIALTVLATPIDVQGIGGMLERTVALAGIQLAVLGVFTLGMCEWSASLDSPKARRLAIAATFFLALLVPVAAITAGKVL